MLQLRPYQRAALDALYAYWQGQAGNALIVLPTGAGKSLVLAELCRELLKDYPSLRIGIVTHVKELIQQNYLELIRLWPQAGAGIYSAGIGRRDARAQILFAGIQSVWNKSAQLGAFDLLLIDEAHLIGRSAGSMYGKFFDAQRELTPDLKVVGLTATPFRLSDGRLDEGKDKLFDKIVYDAAVTDLIEQGYLSPLVSKATAQKLDTSGVQKRGGEFVPGQLEIAIDKQWITRAACEEIVKYGADRKSWLAFCCGVSHAEHVRDALRLHGVAAETVTGETPRGERDRLIRDFKSGQIKCLTSVGVLGTGFNSPQVDLIALLRPTESAGLFVQQCGRGLRKAPGKTDCLVLDFAGLTKRHGPIDQISIETAGGKGEKQEALAKECPTCHTLVALAARTCPTCGHLWPERMEPKHDAVADATTSIISKGAPSWIDVDAVRYFKHTPASGNPPMLRAEYWCGFTVHKEYVGFAHYGKARWHAEQFWKRSANGTIPRDADEALARQKEINPPSQIQIQPDGKYFKVVGRRFEAIKEVA